MRDRFSLWTRTDFGWAALLTSLFFMMLSGFNHSAHADTENVNLWWPAPGYARIAGDGTRRANIESNLYQLSIENKKSALDTLYLKGFGTNLMSPGTLGGITLRVITTDGQLWSSVYADGNTVTGSTGTPGTSDYRPFYQTSTYTHESGRDMNTAHVMYIYFKNATGTSLPMVAEIVPYAWQDRIYYQVRFTATGSITNIWRLEILSTFYTGAFNYYRLDGGSDTAIPGSGTMYWGGPSSVVLFNNSTLGSLAYIIGNTSGTKHFNVWRGTTWGHNVDSITVEQMLWDYNSDGGALAMTTNQYLDAFFQTYFSYSTTSTDAYNQIQIEKTPLTLQILDGSAGGGATTFGGYDNTRGCYNIAIPNYHNTDGAYRFCNKWQDYYDWAKIKIPSDTYARSNRFRVTTQGIWGSAVTADEWGMPRGEPVTNTRYQSMNNYFVMKTAASTPLSFIHKIVSKRWGKSPAFYTSTENLYGSGGAYNHGQLWLNNIGGLQGAQSYSLVQKTYSDLCDSSGIDVNPQSNDTWSIFPENTGGHEFLKYMKRGETTWHELEFWKLKSDRLSPLMLHHKFMGYSDDNLISSTIDMYHIPYSDVARHFYHIRYDILNTVLFDTSGDPMKSKLRLFSIGDEDYTQSSFSTLAYTDSGGSIWSGGWGAVTGYVFGGTQPWVTEYGGSTLGNRGIVLRSWSSKINGVTNGVPGFSLRVIGGNNAGLWMVPISSATQLVAGDYFDIYFEVVFYGNQSSNYSTVQNEAAAFGGTSNFNLTASEGTVESVWPPRLAVDGTSKRTQFTLTGGKDYVPIDVGGFTSYTDAVHKPPLLEEQINNCWVPYRSEVAGNDGYDVHYDPDAGTYRYIFNVFTAGGSRTFRASLSKNRLDCEDYSNSFDTTTGNSGGKYRSDNVDIYASDKGGYYVGLVAPGEWLEYFYTLAGGSSKVVTPSVFYRANGSVSASFTVNGTAQSTFTLPAAATWTSFDAPDVTLNSGSNTIRLNIGGSNTSLPQLDYIQLNYERPTPSTSYDAVVVADSLPVNINRLESWYKPVTVKNIGTSSWSGTSIGLKGVDVLGATPDFWLPSGTTVPAGGTYTFTTAMSAPTITNSSEYQDFTTRWQMERSGNPNFGGEFKHEIYGSAKLGVGQEFVLNPGFEEGSGTTTVGNWILQGANAIRTNVTSHAGTWSGRIEETLPTTDAYLYQDFTVKPYTDYEISGWYATDATIHANTRMMVYGLNTASYCLFHDVNNSAGSIIYWTEYKRPFNSGGNDTVRLYAGMSGTSSSPVGRLYLDDFSITAWPRNFNGGFEDGSGATPTTWIPENAYADRSSSDAHSGTYSGRMQEYGNPTVTSLRQDVNVQPNTNYIVTAWYKTGTTPIESNTQIFVYGYQTASYLGISDVPHSNTTFGWTAQSIIVNTGSNTTMMIAPRFAGNPSSPYGLVYVDDVTVTQWPANFEGDFESGGLYWSRTANANGNNAEQAHGGHWSGELAEHTGTTNENFYKDVDVLPSSTYDVSAWFKSGSATLQSAAVISVYGYQSATTIGSSSVSRGSPFGWVQQSTGTFSTGTNTKVRITVGISGSPTGTMGLGYVDDVTITKH